MFWIEMEGEENLSYVRSMQAHTQQYGHKFKIKRSFF